MAAIVAPANLGIAEAATTSPIRIQFHQRAQPRRTLLSSILRSPASRTSITPCSSPEIFCFPSLPGPEIELSAGDLMPRPNVASHLLFKWRRRFCAGKSGLARVCGRARRNPLSCRQAQTLANRNSSIKLTVSKINPLNLS